MNIIDTFLWLILSLIYRRPVARYGFHGPLPPNPWQPPRWEPWRPQPAPPEEDATRRESAED